MTEDEMVGWFNHQLNGHEFEQTLGDSKGQGSLACCSPWSRKEFDTTERISLPFGNLIQHITSINLLVYLFIP